MSAPPLREAAPPRVGRFEILRELGRGALGVVHLATDLRLGRQVALKTLHLQARETGQLQALLDEARIVSRLKHPNIVTLYDVGEQNGEPYLVFEYVQGINLAQRIRAAGRLPAPEAIRIALALLEGVGYAHAQQVLHRDLKPANVILTADGVPRLTDFGLARYGAATEDAELRGTPAYMSPEYIERHVYEPSSDLFALAVVLYEMLTGATPVKSQDSCQTLLRIVNEGYEPPSRTNPDVTEELDRIVMKALSKTPGDRYESAMAMSAALSVWLAPESMEAAPDAPPTPGTLEFLMRRMRYKSDFPALAGAVTAVSATHRSDREHLSVLCNSILKDFSITNKLLRIVNASHYAQFGGISTVSRAVAILGIDQVRSVAMSLMLFEHLHDKAQAAELKDEMVASYFGAILSGDLCALAGVRDTEQAFICSMFHRLGRLLACCYLREEAQAVSRLMAARDIDERQASRQVLGISYEELGAGVGKAWNLPETIVASMRRIDGKVTSRPVQEDEKLRLVADLSNNLAHIVRTAGEHERGAKLAALVEKFGPATGISQKRLTEAVKDSMARLVRDAEVLGYSATNCPVVANARKWNHEPVPAAIRADPIATIVSSSSLPTSDHAHRAAAPEQPAPEATRQALLTAGVQDITTTLVGTYELNDVLRMVLETMYRAMGFTRVLLFVAEAGRNALRCRFGFGVDAETLINSRLCVPLSGARDVFYAAITQGADLCIEDIDSDKVKAYIPKWYREAIRSRGMVLLPIIVRKKPIGLIYADVEASSALQFKSDELNLLKTLRNQAVLAVRNKS